MKIIIDGQEYIDMSELLEKAGFKQATLYIRLRYTDFPQPIKIPQSFWKSSDVDAYLDRTRELT
jgi:predicted DNA-binding transcriptional regulator AlpA